MKQLLIEDAEDHITEAAVKGSAAKIVGENSILIVTRSGILTHTLPVAKTKRSVAINQDLKAVVLADEYEPNFILHAIRAHQSTILETCRKSGTTVANLDTNGLLDFEIAIPSKEEQRRIITKLESLFARSESARKELGHIPKLVERYKQAVLAAAFRGELSAEWREQHPDIESSSAAVARISVPPQPRGGREATESVIPGLAALSVNSPATPAPRGWAWVPLVRVSRQETGHTPSRSHPEWWGGEIPWIGIRDAAVHHGHTIYETVQMTNPEGLANSAARLLPASTVCLSRTASVGYVLMMGRDMATSQDFVTWTCCEQVLSPKFLMYALMAEGEEIRRFGKGSTHTTIYFPEVRAMHICLPPIEEQLEIVVRVELALESIQKASVQALTAESLVNRLEAATLAKAFRGELAIKRGAL